MDYKNLSFALSKIGIALTSETNLNNLFFLIVSEVIKFAKCDACSLYLREYEPDRLVFHASRTISLEKKESNYLDSFKAKPVKLEKSSIAGYTALTGKIVNIADCYTLSREEEYKFNKAYDKISNYQTVSMLSVPMRLQDGSIIGVIQLINKLDEKHNIIPFSKEFEKIISSIASQAAVAIHNARLQSMQSESSFMFNFLILSLCVYSFFLAYFKSSVFEHSYTIITLIFTVYFLIICVILIRRSKLPINNFGLSLKNLKQSIIESLVVTLLIIVIITLVKIQAVKHWDMFKGTAVIDFSTVGWPFFAYLFIAPVQEFVTRGVIQSTIERIMPGKYDWLWGIVVCSCLFGTFHIFYSFNLAYLTIISGLLWGYMFVRHRNIIGVSISHFCIGNYLVLTNFWNLIIN